MPLRYLFRRKEAHANQEISRCPLSRIDHRWIVSAIICLALALNEARFNYAIATKKARNALKYLVRWEVHNLTQPSKKKHFE